MRKEYDSTSYWQVSDGPATVADILRPGREVSVPAIPYYSSLSLTLQSTSSCQMMMSYCVTLCNILYSL
jgi:hypothetical protein